MIEIKRAIKKTEEFEFTIDNKQLVSLLRRAGINVQDNAEITFTVPNGGDYSGMKLEVSET